MAKSDPKHPIFYHRVIFPSVLFIFLFLLTLPVISFSQWTWQNPLPQGNNLDGVQFVDSNTAFAVGNSGTIIKTTDKGVTWTEQNSDAYQDLSGVYFVNPQVGYVVGTDNSVNYGYIFKTTNGGSSWTQLPVVFGDQANCVWFTGENTGYVGTWAHLYKTTDRGENWQILTGFQCYCTCLSLFFTDSLTGYVTIPGQIYKTTDAGNSWTLSYNDPTGPAIISLYFTSSQNGFATGADGNRGTIYKTTDAGLTWNRIIVPSALQSVFFATPQTGIVLGTPFQYRTTDGGNSWQPQTPPINNFLISGSFADSLSGLIVGHGGTTAITNDGGATWNVISSSVTSNGLSSLFFVSSNLGFASGDSGTIIKTTNGGNLWQKCSTGTLNPLSDLWFTSSDVGYTCGSKGTILKTTNSGSSWYSIYSSSSSDTFVSVKFPSQNVGYVLSPSKLLKTTDAGNSWGVKASTGFYNVSMYFTTNDTGYISGLYGQIMMTPDGGNTLISLNTGVTTCIPAIYFSTKTTGFAVGYHFILKTEDRGNTWQTKYDGSIWPHYSNCINFSDSLHGFIMNDDSLFLTNDGGDIWQGISLANYSELYSFTSVWFTDSVTGYIAGSNGIILNTTNGGIITGVNQNLSQDKMINVYPNPNNGRFFIELPTKEPVNIQIYDMCGRIIYQSKFMVDQSRNEINLLGATSGIYFVKMVSSQKTWSQKIVIF
jgi:photosystem II stability/assembly factor-like uncharacterized protein